MNEICGDNRFEIIAKAKADLLEGTNIETDEAEMAVIDNILFRYWQMGWLDRYDRKTEPSSSEIPNNCTDCEHWTDTEDGCADRHGCRATTEDWQDWKDRMWSEAIVTEPTTEDCSTVDKDINVRSKDEPQTEMPRCSVNGTPFDECGFCEYFNCDTCKCEADVPQTERSGE